MDCSMPGFPVFCHLLEFAQTHVHWVSDAMQPSHPLSAYVCVCVYAHSMRPTLSDLRDCDLLGSSVHGIYKAGILEWVPISSSRRSLQRRDQTPICCIGRQILYHSATWEALFTFTVTLSVPSFSHVQFFATPWTAACQASLSFTTSLSFLKIMLIEPVMPFNHLTLYPLSSFLQSFPESGPFPVESVFCIRWPKYWSFSISPSNEYLGLISFRMDWFDLLEVQGTLKSFLQQHSSKASVLWRSVFFMLQLSHPYMTTGKTIALLPPMEIMIIFTSQGPSEV